MFMRNGLLHWNISAASFWNRILTSGISILTECADSGDKLFCYWIGKIYLDGKITAQDLDKAEKYLLAADKNEYTFLCAWQAVSDRGKARCAAFRFVF